MTKITTDRLNPKPIQYWAVDDAFFGNCRPTDLLFVNQHLADLDMLAVPGIFEQGIKKYLNAYFNCK